MGEPSQPLEQWQKDYIRQTEHDLSNMDNAQLGDAYGKALGGLSSPGPTPETYTDGALALAHMIAKRDGDTDQVENDAEIQMARNARWRRTQRYKMVEDEGKHRGLEFHVQDDKWTATPAPVATPPPQDPGPTFGAPWTPDGPSADPHLDTGHYDDGHSFGWKQPDAPSTDPHLDTGQYDDGHSFGWKQATPQRDPDEDAAWRAFYQTQGVNDMKGSETDPGVLGAQDDLDTTLRGMSVKALKRFQQIQLDFPHGNDDAHGLTPANVLGALAASPDDGKRADPSQLTGTPKWAYDRAQRLIDDATLDPHLDTGQYDDGHSFGWKQTVSRVPGGIATLGGVAALVVALGGFALARGGTPPAATQRPAVAITASATPKTPSPTNAPTQPAGPSGATAASQGYKCQGGQMKLFDNWNTGVVDSGGAPVTFSTNGKTYCLVTLATYHWNNGSGAIPGTIQLVGSNGTISGRALGTNGQDNVPDANWVVSYAAGQEPLLSGSYQCKDSDPATWAQNDDSQHAGFCRVWVTEAVK